MAQNGGQFPETPFPSGPWATRTRVCALWEVPGSVTREPPRGNDRVATGRQHAACTRHGRGRGDPGSLPLSTRCCTHGQRLQGTSRPAHPQRRETG